MNAPTNFVKSRKDIEEYVLKILKEIYWEFPREISPCTTFKELERHADPDLTDPGLLIYIEEDLGVYLPDEEVQKLDEQKDVDVAALIDAIIRCMALTKAVHERKHDQLPSDERLTP
ncbi:hypothetical protein HYR99_01630 [Candidatus Poribacteria bacterium]|nr:hypothetical protein [Candidatus Poribacteria bacterium]